MCDLPQVIRSFGGWRKTRWTLASRLAAYNPYSQLIAAGFRLTASRPRSKHGHMTFDQALDEIYRSWLAARPHLTARYDRDVRHPEIVHRIAARLGLLPPPERVIKVTGSKGKGTTSRFAADLVAQAAPDARVALFVSPHEVEQTDRIRLDGEPISEDEFRATVERLSAAVREQEPSLPPGQYISPVGYFLLVALDWYKRQGADWFVLECGRGARRDDVGTLPSQVSVVTSILLEHADTLGPGIADIAADKFSVAENSDHVIASAGAMAHAPATLDRSRVDTMPSSVAASDAPRWITDCRTLGQRAAERLLDLTPGALDASRLRIHSASFGEGAMGHARYIFEAAINTDSLDLSFLATLPGDTTVLACLSDGKDRERMTAALSRLGRVKEIELTGAENYLHFSEAHGRALPLSIDDASGLRDLIRETEGLVYLVGTQSFIRLVHRAIALDTAMEAACSA